MFYHPSRRVFDKIDPNIFLAENIHPYEIGYYLNDIKREALQGFKFDCWCLIYFVQNKDFVSRVPRLCLLVKKEWTFNDF